MCGAGGDNSSNDSGGGDKDDKPAKKKKNIIKEIFTPTPESIAKNKVAGAKDTSFTGVFNSLMSGEKHAPRQSLLEFGKTQGLPNTGPPSQGFKEGTSSIKAASPRKRIALTIGNSSGGGGSSGGSNQDTALAGGSAGRTSDVNNKKNMLAVNRKVRAKGKKGTRNMSGLAYSSKGTGLNIST